MLVRRLDDCDEFLAGDHTHLRELLHPAKGAVKATYSVAHATVRPGESSLPHRLYASELYYILAGEGLMRVHAEEQTVSASTIVYIPPGAVQSIVNTGRTDLTFLCIVEPAWQAADEELL